MASLAEVQPPDLPELETQLLSAVEDGDGLILAGVRVDHDGQEAVRADRVQIRESELRRVVLEAENAPGLSLVDVVLRDCDLSNVDGREGSIRRLDVHRSRLIGFGLTGGKLQDVRVVDSSLMLARFAFARLRSVVFERVDLAEASFMEAQLEAVAFIDCKLAGADFRRAKLKDCTIRGSSLDGVVGVASLAGTTMAWTDVLGSAAALASALGITVEAD